MFRLAIESEHVIYARDLQVPAALPASRNMACSAAGAGAAWPAPTPPSCSLPRRHRTLPLVCRRWWAVVCCPPLLRCVRAAATGAGFLLKLRSLSAFLLTRAAGHMQSAVLRIWPDLDDTLSAAQQQEVDTTTGALLAACAVAGCLTELRLSLGMPLCIGGWAAALRGLRQLHLSVYSPLVDGVEYSILLQGPLLGSKLEDLRLHGCPLLLPDTARLPSSLTALGLLGLQGMLPPQVSGAAVCKVYAGEPAEACG